MLNDADKEQIVALLNQDVDIGTIVKKFNLPDADILYELKYSGGIRNRVIIAGEKYSRSARAGGAKSNYHRLLEAIAAFAKGRRRPLEVLEQGCGDGSLAHNLAQAFPDAALTGIEITAAGVEYARQHFTAPNLSFRQQDGYQLDESVPFDVVYHLNVLEHVPDPVAYLEKGLAVLSDGGLLCAGFPTLNYWKFWGWPKYLLCRLLGREFQYHGWDPRAMDRFIREKGLQLQSREYSIFCLPRRLYYFVPDRLLAPLGRLFKRIEDVLQDTGFTAPLMFVFYALRKDGGATGRQVSRQRNWKSLGQLTWVLPVVAVSLSLSTLCLALEVLSGRKAVFDQH